MPSLIVTASTTAQQIAAERENAAHYPKSMTIDNDGGSADRVIRIQDVFTTSLTNGAAAASKEIDRLRVDVLQGDMVTLSEQDLKGIKCLGALKIIADAVDAGCYITWGYHTR